MDSQPHNAIGKSEEKPCRHEYVKIFQRRLKGLERRLVSTRGYLPIGFKQGDFGHLGEGSFCFCAKCRMRLFPRRTQADKAAARLALAQSKGNDQLVNAELADLALDLSETSERESAELTTETTKETSTTEVSVDELDYESTEMDEIQQDRVKLSEEDEDDEEGLAEKEEEI